MMQESAPTSRSHVMRQLFGLTIGLAAALLFWQELMLGRMMLPTFGSVPTVWLVSLVVFQAVLLAGYLLAHAMRRLPRGLLLVGLGLLIAGAVFQHVSYPTIAALEKPESINATSVICTLLSLSGGSLLLLSMFSPLLQSIYARQPHEDAHDPYFLYGASNIGSFIGLLLFPIVLEPAFGVRISQTIWYGCGVLLVLLLLTCVIASPKLKPVVPEAGEQAEKKPNYLALLFYSFLPSALSYGATSHLISDIAPVPLLSMVPLALYLLSFVLAFSRKDRFRDDDIVLQVFLVAFFLFREIYTGFKPSHVFDILIILAAFFLTAWRFHRQLSLMRPSAHYLTAYYLTIALGGVLGGIFSVFVVPFITPMPIEFSVLLLISLLPNWKVDLERLKLPHLRKLHGLVFIMLALAVVFLVIQALNNEIATTITPVLLIIALMLCTMLPSVLAASAAVMIGIVLWILPAPLEVQRDFFGVKRIVDNKLEDGLVYRSILHGTTCHGMQQRTPHISLEPALYYARGSGVYDAMSLFKPQQVGIVGLGTGTVACEPPKGASVRFFEIDPGVELLAKKYFTFLQNCPAEIVIGDARFTLAKDTHHYDMLVLDAFSSDAIPVHLLTKEMFDTYAQRLTDHGVLLLHISNRYLDLRHVLAGVAQQMQWQGATKNYFPEHPVPSVTASEYVAFSKDPAVMQKLLDQPGWTSLDDIEPLFWTDDHISIIPLLNFGFGK